MKSRTIQYGPNGGIEIVQREVGPPGAGEVQVEGLTCGICAADVYMYQHGPFTWGQQGHEGVGRVIAVGPDVPNLKVGDRVSGGGLGFSERQNAAARDLYVITDLDLPDEHCILEPVSCAVTGLDNCHLRPGDRIALVGCGFMGAMILQGLLRSFVERVVVVEKHPHRIELARKLGASEVWSPDDADWEHQLADLSRQEIDTVVDTTGAQPGLDLSTRICRAGGRINLFGWNKSDRTIAASDWHTKGITIVNSSPQSALRDAFAAAIRVLRAGIIDLQPLVSHVVKLDDYPALLAKAAKLEDGYIKGVVRVAG